MNYTLTKKEQEILRLRNRDGKSTKEIAEMLKITPEEVERLKTRALRKIERNNPEHSCDDCYHYWGFVPTCHNYPHGKRACDRWEPKDQPKEVDEYQRYQEEWN